MYIKKNKKNPQLLTTEVRSNKQFDMPEITNQ